MRIAVIGGLDRDEVPLSRMAVAAGHRLDFHTGAVGGRGAAELRAMIARAELVLVLTDVNSHGAVLLAKKEAHKLGRATLVLRRCGPTRFQQLLDAVSVRTERLKVAS